MSCGQHTSPSRPQSLPIMVTEPVEHQEPIIRQLTMTTTDCNSCLPRGERQSQAAHLSAEREHCLVPYATRTQGLHCHLGSPITPKAALNSTRRDYHLRSVWLNLLQHACALDAVQPLLPLGRTSTSGVPAKHWLPGDLRSQLLKASVECVEAWHSPPTAADITAFTQGA